MDGVSDVIGDVIHHQHLIKVALVLELKLELGFNLVNHIKPRGNPNTNINMNPIPIQNPLLICNTDPVDMPSPVLRLFDAG